MYEEVNDACPFNYRIGPEREVWQMALKRTGPGKAGMIYGPSDGFKHVVLYNFDIDGADVKREHREFLDKHVVPMLRREGSISISGRASRTGSDGHNRTLSDKRSKAVFDYLFRTTRSTRIYALNGTGEEIAAADGVKNGVEDEYYRAVLVSVSKNSSPPRRVPDVDVKPKPPKKNWSSMVRASADISAIDFIILKKMSGTFMIDIDLCNDLRWKLSASNFKLSIPLKGKPPFFPANFTAKGKPFAYDRDLIDFKALWKDKTIYLLTGLNEIVVEIQNALPRMCSADYRPFKGPGVRCVGRDVHFNLKTSRLELGVARGVGSIQSPKWKTVPCA